MVPQDHNCVLCNGAVEESLNHLFLDCPFAVRCWRMINLQVDHNSEPFHNLQSFRDQLGVPFFLEIIILLAWTIWRSRNDLIFRQINPSLALARLNFNEEFQWLLLRARKSYSPAINQWISNLN